MHRLSLVDEWARRNRWATRHPAEKALAALAGVLLVAWLPSPSVPPLIAGLTLVLLHRAGVPLPVVARVVGPPAVFLLVFALPIAVNIDAELHAQVDAESAWRAVAAGTRGTAALLVTMTLALTTPVTDIAWLLCRCAMPRGSVDALLGMHRFLFALRQTLQALCAAQRARLGFLGWSGTVRSAGCVAGALWGRTMDRALGLERGSIARGGLPLSRMGAADGSEGEPLSRSVCAVIIAVAVVIAFAVGGSR